MNGKPPTADTIRTDGLAVAERIRALANQAKAEGEALATQAEEIAGAIIAASEEVANRVTDYLAKCAAARAAMQEHERALTLPLPPAPQLKPHDDTVTKAALQAVEHSLGDIPPRRGR